MDVRGTVRAFVDKHDLLPCGACVVVGVSGGPDSLCLLHVLHELRGEYDLILHVAHMEHGIRGEGSLDDARFVARLAEAWGLPATVEHCDVPTLAAEHKLSMEEAARQARYGFLARLAHGLGACRVAVGHHADDQVETVLMHWLRGAGLAGLRGMTPSAPLGELRLAGLAEEDHLEIRRSVRLIRPLLEVPRAEIEAYCRQQGLEPRFDRSNLDKTYFRNRLRLEVVPYLETYNPNIRQVLRRSAAIIADDYDYLREAMQDAWDETIRSASNHAIAFDLDEWRRLPINLQRALLREAIHRLRCSLRNINWVHVENALDVARQGTTGDQATLPQGLMLRLGYHTITITQGEGQALGDEIPLLHVPELEVQIPGTTPLPETGWQLEACSVSREELPADFARNPDPWRAYLDARVAGTELVLRQRRPGDRFQPLGMGGHAKLVGDWMTNAKVPARYRDHIPLLASAEDILWIGGGQVDERAKITPRTTRVLGLAFVRCEDPEEDVHEL